MEKYCRDISHVSTLNAGETVDLITFSLHVWLHHNLLDHFVIGKKIESKVETVGNNIYIRCQFGSFALWGISCFCPLFFRHHSLVPLPHSSVHIPHSVISAALHSTSSFFPPPVSHTRLQPSPHLFLTILLRTLPPRSRFFFVLFFLSSLSLLPCCSLFHRPDIWVR